MHLPDPKFPPLLTAYDVRRPVDPLPEAVRLAGLGDIGAGDVVWSRRTDRAELAIVLEPEVALGKSCQMVPLVMVALGEALGQLLPPQVAVEYKWPDQVLVNGGLAGTIQVVSPPCEPGEVPAWLIVNFGLQLERAKGDSEPGHTAHLTSLFEEGGGDVTRTDVMETFGAYFMSWMHAWSSDGFRGLHDQWLLRAAGRTQPCVFDCAGSSVEGTVLGLDEEAGLIVKPVTGKAVVLPFAPFVKAAGELAQGVGS